MLLASQPHSGTQLSRCRQDTDNGHHGGGRGAPRRAAAWRQQGQGSGSRGVRCLAWLGSRGAHVSGTSCLGSEVPIYPGGQSPATHPACTQSNRVLASEEGQLVVRLQDLQPLQPSTHHPPLPSQELPATRAAGLQPSAQPPHSGAAQQMGTRDSLNTWTVLDFIPNLTAGHRPGTPQSLGTTAPLRKPAGKEPA